MGEIKYFTDETVIGERGHNEPLVEFLEKSLERAKNGEIVGMAGAVQYVDGAAGNFSTGFIRTQIMAGAMTCAIIHMVNNSG
jgi:hypothetical protein